MAKTEVYSWRVKPEHKMALEQAARDEGVTIGRLLDRLTERWISARKRKNGDDEAEQKRLHAAAARCFGSISGDDPHRSEKVNEIVRQRLLERYGR
jgi:hypothetical protein